MKGQWPALIFLLGAAIFASGCSTKEASSHSKATNIRPEGSAGHNADHTGEHSGAESAFLFPDGDDKGWSKLINAPQHTTAPAVPLANLPAPVRTQLINQLTLTVDPIKKCPTVKDAEAAGYRRVGPFVPGMGTHYMGGIINRSGTLTDEEILHPSSILYAGTAPDSRIVGLMYQHEPASDNSGAPEGFIGPNDHWHRHSGICLKAASNGAMDALGADGFITEAECTSKGGKYSAHSPWAVHVWTVPAYTSPLGVFSHLNPAVTCPNGTYYRGKGDITNTCRK